MYLGIDLGTSKIAVVLYSSEDNKIIYTHSFPHKALKIKNNFYELNPLRIKEICFEILENILYKEKIKGIGISTQMHGCLIVDKKINPITPFITWEDKRTLLDYKEGRNYVDYIKEVCGKELKKTGTTIAPGFMGATLFYLKENSPHLFKKGNKICFLGDYITSLLTNENIKTDITNAGSSGIFDIEKKEWLWEVIDNLKIPEFILPFVVEPGEIIGRINKKVSSQIGINNKCIVGVSIGDNQASILGSAGYLENKCVLNMGTGSQISTRIENYKKFKFCDTRYFIKNKYISVGTGLSGGKTLKIIEKFLKETGKKMFNTKRSSLYKKMHNIAVKGKKSDILAGTFFSGSRVLSQLNGFLMNLKEENFKIENILFSFYLGVILELYFYFKNMKTKVNEIIGSGNGFRKNSLFGEISSSLFNIPVSISKTKEEAATGASLLIAEKVAKINIEDFINKNMEKKVYTPDKELNHLQKIYEIFEKEITRREI